MSIRTETRHRSDSGAADAAAAATNTPPKNVDGQSTSRVETRAPKDIGQALDLRPELGADAAAYAALVSSNARSSSAPPATSSRPMTPAAAAVVHPERTFTTIEPLGVEVLRLRSELAKASDPSTRSALAARVGQLSTQWCAMARSAGMQPPSASFNPSKASDKELKNAILWTEVGNTFPIGTFGHSVNPDHFRDDILSEWTLRTPGMLDRVIAANPKDARLVPLVEADLRRRGETECRPNETVGSLLERRADLIRKEQAKADAEDAKRLYMGLDGQIGPGDAIGNYEAQQYIIAMNPGTTTGSLLAAVAASRGEGIERMRAAGAAGSFVEGLAGKIGPGGERTTDGKVEGGRAIPNVGQSVADHANARRNVDVAGGPR